MPEVLQIVGSILLLVAGVAVILYVLFRKSPVKEEERAEATPEDETANDEPAEESAEDDIPDGEPPAEIEKED